ncbi:MAG: hypothetical protein M5U12_15255 [Verrucomicrobia bacterium]|nr:hypothetical protein [Verrucomicrobiota bacterium]
MDAGEVVAFGVQLAVQMDEGGGADLFEELTVIGEGEVECPGDFVVIGDAAGLLFEGGEGVAEFAGLVVDGTRDPIHAAKFIEDRTADPDAGEGFGRRRGCRVGRCGGPGAGR